MLKSRVDYTNSKYLLDSKLITLSEIRICEISTKKRSIDCPTDFLI